jgi:hypothetical protein
MEIPESDLTIDEIKCATWVVRAKRNSGKHSPSVLVAASAIATRLARYVIVVNMFYPYAVRVRYLTNERVHLLSREQIGRTIVATESSAQTPFDVVRAEEGQDDKPLMDTEGNDVVKRGLKHSELMHSTESL